MFSVWRMPHAHISHISPSQPSSHPHPMHSLLYSSRQCQNHSTTMLCEPTLVTERKRTLLLNVRLFLFGFCIVIKRARAPTYTYTPSYACTHTHTHTHNERVPFNKTNVHKKNIVLVFIIDFLWPFT